jgi:RHS repeat-associated protein
MKLRSTSSAVSSALSIARHWLRDAWLASVPILDWARRLLRPRRSHWDASGKPRKTLLDVEALCQRETPADLFGILGTPLLGTGLGLVGGSLLTPAAVLVGGWSAAASPLPSPHVSASDGLRAPGLSSALATPPTADAGLTAAAPADNSAPAAPAPTFSTGPAATTPDDPFADPLGGDWLAAVGAALSRGGAAPKPAASQATPSAPADNAGSPAPAPAVASQAPADASGPAGVDPFVLTSGTSTAASNTAAAGAAPLTSSSPSIQSGAAGAGQGTAQTAAFLQAYGRDQLAFTPNLGQADPTVRFLAQGSGFETSFTDAGAVLSLPTAQPSTRDVLQLSLVGANTASQLYGTDRLPSSSNYYLGPDPSRWLSDVPNYGQLVYHDAYRGIDIAFHGNAQNQLEYDFVASPDADLSQIKLSWQGAKSVAPDGRGDLLVTTASGQTLTETAPVLYQQADGGGRTPVSGDYVLNADGTTGFRASGYDPAKPLVIDPSLFYSSYLGAGGDTAYAVATDAAGDAFLTGSTTSTNFPTTVGAYQTTNGDSTDVFVAKLNPQGKVVFSTYLGGTNASFSQTGYGVAVDLWGRVWVVGTTTDTSFPTTSDAVARTFAYNSAAFVARLGPAGDNLTYSTLMGSGSVSANAVATDAEGDAYVTGSVVGVAGSPFSFFPTTSGAFQTTPGNSGGATNAFVTKLTPQAPGSAASVTVTYGSYLGGVGSDAGYGIAADGSGDAFIAGLTNSSNFPTTSGAFKTSYPGGQSSFVAKVNPSGSTLVYSTYLAGSSGGDAAYAIAVDRGGSAYVTGVTRASFFPTTSGAYQTSLAGGGPNAFVAKLNSAGSALTYGTYLGGGGETGKGIGVDAAGQAVVAGYTTGSSFPTTTGAPQTSSGGGIDAFLARLNAAGSALVYGSYLGGSGTDEAEGVSLDAQGNAYLAGYTASTNFPTTPGAFQGGPSGTTNAFIARVSQAPPPPIFTAISPDTGSSSTDQVTNTGNVTITGTAAANATVTLWQEGTGVIDTVTANSSGLWTSTYYAASHTLPEGTAAFTASQSVGGITSDPSADWLVTVDLTNPTVTLTAPASTASKNPLLRVSISDRNPPPNGTAVTLKVYASDGVTLLNTNTSAATLTDGQASWRLAYTLTPGTTYVLKALVNDLAGNTGTSAGQTVAVTSVAAWSLASAVQLTSDPLGGDALDQLGNLQVQHALDLDQSPGNGQSGGAALVYNSDAVSVQPVIEATLNSPNNASLPSTITAVLTWNGTPTTFTYSTSADQPGDQLALNVQVPNAVTTTGRTAWSLSLQATGMTTQNASGAAFVVAEDSSPFGAGWTFGPTDQLVSIAAGGGYPAGMLRVFGDGQWSFYQGTATFSSPADDSGTLTTGGGLYTYTFADGRTETFNGAGYETQWASADGQQTLQFRYNGSNQLTSMTAIDGGLSTFSYSGGLLSTIQTVNSRTTTFAYSGANLTKVTNPDGGLHTFTYDTSHHVLTEAFGGRVNGWAYYSGGALASLVWGAPQGYGQGDSPSPSITPFNAAAAQALTATAPGPLLASRTDADNHTTAWQLDSQGRPLTQYAADGGATQFARDANGRVTAVTDPLNRTTTFALDSSGYVTTQTNPDGSTVGFQYQTAFHALISTTNERGYTATAAYDSQGHLTSTTDALGDVATYAYNGSGLETSVTDPLNHTTTLAYDSNRRLTTATDALNHSATFTYDANGNPLTTTDALGRVVTTNYDVMGRLTQTTNALGGVSTAAYDAAGQELSATDGLGRVSLPVYDSSARGLFVEQVQASGTAVQADVLQTFDAAGRTTAVRDAMGEWTNYALDALGRATQTTDAMGGATQSAYDLAGQRTAVRDALGAWTKYAYNSRGWVTSVTDPLGNVTTIAYNLHGNATAVTDPLGHTVTTAYDKLNRATAVTDALSHTVTTTFDKAGNVSTETDANGNVTSYAYDAVNRRTMTTVAMGSSVQATMTVAYDAVGNVTSSTDPLGHATAYKYDGLNRRTAVTDALSHTTTTAYDLLCNVTAVTDALNHTSTYVYNQLNHLLTTTDPLNHTTTAVIDVSGDARATIDPLGDVTQTLFDQDHRPIGKLDALGGLTRVLPNAAGETAAVIDAVGNQTKYIYDADGRQIVSIDPLGNRTTTTYDAASRGSTATDRDGRQQVFHYDNADRLTAVTWLSAAGATVNLLTYSYDANGNQLTAADYSGTYTNAYDGQDRLTSQTNPFGLTLTYQYDAQSRRTQRSDSLGGVLTYVYDNADRLTSEQFAGTGQTSLRADFGYDNGDELSSLTRYSDLAGSTVVATTVYGYDNAGRSTSITNKNASAATLSYYNYGYDNADRVTSQAWQSTTATGTVSGTNSYSYDAGNQLLSDGVKNYGYDCNGNRNTAGYQVGAGNHITTDGTWTYTYDNAGDLTQKSKGSGLETWYYTYDTIDRLMTVQQTSNGTALLMTATYSYDIYNNLIARNVWVSGGAATLTRYDYDGTQEWAETDGSNAMQVRDLYGAGFILARTASAGQPNAGVNWYLVDRQSSTTDIIGASSATSVLVHCSYDGYGNETDTAASVVDQHGYAGYFTDRLVVLDLAGVRWYNPATGTWTTIDPIAFESGTANLSGYVSNDPTNATDPSGLFDVNKAMDRLKSTNPVIYQFVTTHDIRVEAIDNFWNSHPLVSVNGKVISIDDRVGPVEAADLIRRYANQADPSGWGDFVQAYSKAHPEPQRYTGPAMQARDLCAEEVANEMARRAYDNDTARKLNAAFGPNGYAWDMLFLIGGAAGYAPITGPFREETPEIQEKSVEDFLGAARARLSAAKAQNPDADALDAKSMASAKGPIITQEGKYSAEDLAANLKGLDTPTAKRIAIWEYLTALKDQREAAGKTLDVQMGMTKEGGVVFFGPAGGMASPVGPGGEINRNVIFITPEGKVYELTLEGLSPVNQKHKYPIVQVDLTKGRAVEIPH